MTAEEAIRSAIADHGPISFAEFMELALYGPDGYYTIGAPVSAAGDFYTSPTAHPLFGWLLAVQLEEMWLRMDSPDVFTVVEEGAGTGALAADITEAAHALNAGFADALNYIAIDLVPPASQHYPVHPVASRPSEMIGCLLSNELLDAMPVHRFEASAGRLQEIFVDIRDDKLVEALGEPSKGEIEERIGDLAEALPDGYRGEINLGLESWAQTQASMLDRGWVLAIDYGFARSELYRSDRLAGSLRTYHQHTLGQNPLLRPGRQDITSHVDFTAVAESMNTAGFREIQTTTQAEFLGNLGIDRALARLHHSELAHPQIRANTAGISSLVNPDAMGGFVVAAYSRDATTEPLSGFAPPGTARELPEIPLPKAGRHIDLTRHGQAAESFEVASFEHLFSDSP